MLDDTLPVPADAAGLGLKQDKRAYIARRGSQAVAVILPVTAPDGYSGAIDLIVGVNADGSVAGVRTLAHKETPGLGDAVDIKKSGWILGFDGRSLSNPEPARWALEYAQAHHDELFAPAPAGDGDA